MSRSERIETIAAELARPRSGGDVTSPDDLARLVGTALDRHGRIDGAVINTGHPPKGEILAIADEDWHRAADVVLMPSVRLMRLLQPVFARQKSGAAVAISSYAAREPELTYPLSVYVPRSAASSSCASRVTAARAGGSTPSCRVSWTTTRPSPRRSRASPTGRHAAVETELGATIAFLLSDEAGYITGQGLLVDGGLVRAL